MTQTSNIVGATGFSQWLFRHKDDDTIIGDLARDGLRVSDWPRQGTSFEEFYSHMRFRNASTPALEALVEAWHEYSGEEVALPGYDEDE